MNEGDVFESKNYGQFEIIKIVNLKNILIKFLNTNKTKSVRDSSIRLRNIKDNFAPIVYGHGFFGEGKYKCKINGVKTPEHKAWHSMLLRCYDKKDNRIQRFYSDCEVAEEFFNFQDFAEWFVKRYKNGYCLDKDLKIYGNKIYSKDTCVIVPQEINVAFHFRKNETGLPLGVKLGTYNTKTKRFKSRNKTDFSKVSGFLLLQDAIDNYWEYKYNFIKMLSNKYPEYKELLENYIEHYFNEHYVNVEKDNFKWQI